MLLGLLAEGEGVAARALDDVGVTLGATRLKVAGTTGRPGTGPGKPPFSPRAKKVLELALREALQMGHHDIGTEHILLGIVREGEGVGARTLVALGADLAVVRKTTLRRLGQGPGRFGPHVTGKGRIVTCSFCGRRPPESGRLVASGPAAICEHCVEDWHGRLAGSQEHAGPPALPELLGPAGGHPREVEGLGGP